MASLLIRITRSGFSISAISRLQETHPGLGIPLGLHLLLQIQHLLLALLDRAVQGIGHLALTLRTETSRQNPGTTVLTGPLDR